MNSQNNTPDMTTWASFIISGFIGFSYCSLCETCVGNVSLSVSVSSNSTLLVDWSSGNPQASQCALLISTEGRKEIHIHLLPRSGSLILENITQNGKHSFLCTCFAQSQGLLCSKNISAATGAPAPVIQTSDNPCSASNSNMKWLSSGVFGTTVATCVILTIYIIYRRWTGNGIVRLRLR